MSQAREHEEDRFALTLLPYLCGDLGEAERARVEAHVAACAACRDTLGAFRGVLAALRAGAHGPPALDWRRYGAELFAKREARAARTAWWTMPRLLPITAAAVATVALVIAWRGGFGGRAIDDEMPIFEQTALGSRLDLLEHYGAIENLDLLENLDLAQDLDGGGAVDQG